MTFKIPEKKKKTVAKLVILISCLGGIADSIISVAIEVDPILRLFTGEGIPGN